MANQAIPPSDQMNEKISCLPSTKSPRNDDLYLYQGFWYPRVILENILKLQETTNFTSRSTDVLLASSPKCGTTWLKALGFAIVHRAKYPDFDCTHPLHTKNPHACVLTIEFEHIHKSLLSELENMPEPRILATHLPFVSLPEHVLASGCRMVYICRNPKDMLVSHWLFLQKLRLSQVEAPSDNSLENAFEQFCNGTWSYGPYWDHVVGYYKASLEWPQNILLLKYEEMHGDTINQVKRLAEFLGYPFSSEEVDKGVVEKIIDLCSFQNLKNMEVNKKEEWAPLINNDAFFRNGKVGDFENYLTPDMIECLDRMTREKFHGINLSF